MVKKKSIRPGWHYYRCEECGTSWRSTTRDHLSLAGDYCINEDCTTNDFVYPYRGIPDPQVQVNNKGFLILEEIEILPE